MTNSANSHDSGDPRYLSVQAHVAHLKSQGCTCSFEELTAHQLPCDQLAAHHHHVTQLSPVAPPVASTHLAQCKLTRAYFARLN